MLWIQIFPWLITIFIDVISPPASAGVASLFHLFAAKFLLTYMQLLLLGHPRKIR